MSGCLLSQLGLKQASVVSSDSLFGDDDLSAKPTRQASAPAALPVAAEKPRVSSSLLAVPAAAAVAAVLDPLSSIAAVESPPSPEATPVELADAIDPLGARMVPPREHQAPPGLLPGERLSAAPVSARRMPDASVQTAADELAPPVPPVAGRLYVTNWRMLWEATAASAADDEAPAETAATSQRSVSIPLYSIDRFIKYAMYIYYTYMYV